MKYLTLLLLLCIGQVRAQEPTQGAESIPFTDYASFTPEDYINMKLPPLHILLENARNSPQVSMYSAEREVEERELKTIRRSWLKYFKLNANYNYGSTDMNSRFYTEGTGSIVQSATGNVQNWWSVGGGVSFPLDEIFNRRNKLKQQKKRIESIGYEVERYHDEICLQIIDAYTGALQHLAMLENAVQTMSTAKAQYLIAQNDFYNGQISSQELSFQRSSVNTVTREYEQTRGELNKALLRLEVLSKTKLITK